MRKCAILFLGMLLVATWVNAGIPAGALSSKGTPSVDKKATQYVPTAQGLLDCSGAVEITLNNTYTGDNTGLISNVSGYGCGYWYEPGGEVVYHLFLASPTMFEATVEGSYCDLDLAVLDQCDENAGCIILVDQTVVTEVPVSGDIYFVVDGYSEEGCPFTLTVTGLPLPPAVTFCDLVVPVTETYYDSYTCTAGQNLVNQPDCAPYAYEGLEAYYEILLTPGSSFEATVNPTFDAALFLLSGCTEPYPCLAFADAGLTLDPEVMTYMNTGTEDMTVYLVIDAYGPGSCGTYELFITITPAEVSVQPTSFGRIKSLFR